MSASLPSRRGHALLLALTCLCHAPLFVACDGSMDVRDPGADRLGVGDPATMTPATPTDPNTPADIGDSTDSTTPTNSDQPTDPERRETLDHRGMRRLTSDQYVRAARYILSSPSLKLPDAHEADGHSPNTRLVFSSETATGQSTDVQGVVRYADSAREIAQDIMGTPESRERALGCAPAGAEDECVRTFFERSLRRAWSRPATSEEVDAFVSIVALGEEVLTLEDGLIEATSALFESPEFIYRAHGSFKDGERAPFTDYEMADRLALFLWDALPDDELLDAAARGELTSEEELRSQIDRMLEDERFGDGVKRFASDWLSLDWLKDLNKNARAFERPIPLDMGDSMRHELETLLHNKIVVEDGDLLELFTSRQVYIDDTLRQIYFQSLDEPVPAGEWEWREVPEDWARGGLLTSAGIMAMNATDTETSIIRRGLFILERMFCETIPDFPNLEAVEAFKNTYVPNETARETSARMRTNQSTGEQSDCALCHNAIDPIGLLFEQFDGVGHHRNKQIFRDEDQNEITRKLIEIPGEVSFFSSDETAYMESPKAFGEYVREHPRTSICLSTLAHRYANGSNLVRADRELITQTAEFFDANGHSVKSLFRYIAMGPDFRGMRADP